MTTDINVKRLNDILRLRLFFSTNEEYSHYVDKELGSNQFRDFKGARGEAYFNLFFKRCDKLTLGDVDLAELLDQYETTSEFYVEKIKRTVHKKNKSFIPALLHSVYLNDFNFEGMKNEKLRSLIDDYSNFDKNRGINIGILILLTFEILPTFYKKGGDVKDIIQDYEEAYLILLDIAEVCKASIFSFDLHPYFVDLRGAIEEEKRGTKLLNRLGLIYWVNNVLSIIYLPQQPQKILKESRNRALLPIEISGLWHDERDAPNIIWKFIPSREKGTCQLFRIKIDYVEKRNYYSKYYVLFIDIRQKEECRLSIVQPSFYYYSLLRRKIPIDAVTHSIAKIELEEDGVSIKTLELMHDSALGKMNLKLAPIVDGLKTYLAYVNHESIGADFEDVDEHAETSVDVIPMRTSVSDTAILLFVGNEIYKIDKFDAEGKETITGISGLTNNENIFIESLTDENGVKRSFLCFDSIGQNLELGEEDPPFIHEIGSIADLF